jgi:hypothetical protein
VQFVQYYISFISAIYPPNSGYIRHLSAKL